MNFVLGGRSIGSVLGRSGGAAGNGLLTGLVAYWALNEASGNAIDLHSGGLTLTAANAPGAAAGQVYATARTFNGASQYFSRASESALQTGDIDFAMSGWFLLSANTGYRPIVSKWGAAGNREWLLYYDKDFNKITMQISANGTTQPYLPAATTADLNTWAMFCAWHDATANKIYLQINGGTVAELAHTGGAYIGTADMMIGKLNAASEYWPGRIGPIAFWKNRTLSADDRTLLWNGGAGLAYSGFS